jgi:hypothetical protein
MAVDALPATEAQELLDRVFQSSAAERERLRIGRVPDRMLGSMRPRPWWASPFASVMFGAWAAGFWAAALTSPSPKPFLAIAVAVVLMLLAAPAALFAAHTHAIRARAERVGTAVRIADATIGTTRTWGPTYGEMSRLFALVVGDGERFITPSALGDRELVLFGRARLHVVQPLFGPNGSPWLLASVEVIDGTVVGRAPSAPSKPDDFLMIASCDPNGAEWAPPASPPPAAPAR